MNTESDISIADRLAIEDLAHLFYWRIDHGRADETVALLAKNARMNSGAGPGGGGTLEGEAIVKFMSARAAMRHVTIRHVISNIVLRANADGSVHGSWISAIYRSEGEARPARQSAPAAVMDSEMTFVRAAGGWQIIDIGNTMVFAAS